MYSTVTWCLALSVPMGRRYLNVTHRSKKKGKLFFKYFFTAEIFVYFAPIFHIAFYHNNTAVKNILREQQQRISQNT